MSKGPFDPRGAVEFDLPKGTVLGAGDRLMVVPASLLEEIAEVAGASAALAAARAIGASCGRRIVSRMGGIDALRAASVESVVSYVAGELALSGVGAAHLERWGRALVIVVANSPTRDDALVAAMVEGALAVATERSVTCVSLARDGELVRVLVASSAAAQRARSLLGKGILWGDVLTKLQAPGDA